MNEVVEVLFTCDNNEHQITCSALDLRTGTNLMTYKGGGCAHQRTLNFLGSHYVLSANNAKPLIHVWPINSQEQLSSVRFVVPGKIDTMCLCPHGNYLVAGIQEVIYIWHISTGRLLNTISKHYQKLCCIKFTDDGSHFATAGKDGVVMVWNLTTAATQSDENQTSLYNFNDHGLPVTDIHIGTGGIRAYMTTVSFDRSCKIYDLSNGSLLLNVVFPEGLGCVTVNGLETSVFVGTTEGSIYNFHTDSLPRTKEYHMDNSIDNRFAGHEGGTTCLVLSLDSQTLVSGGQDSKVCIWHIPSKQLLKTFLQRGIVTNIALRLTSLIIFNPDQKQPQIFTSNLKRMIDPPEAEEEIEILIEQDSDKQIEGIKNSDAIYPLDSCCENSPDAMGWSSTDGREDIQKLRDEVRKLQQINKKLFEISCRNILKNK